MKGVSKKLLKILTMLVFFISFWMTEIAKAHMLWVEKEGFRFNVLWGHKGKTEFYDKERLAKIGVYDKRGNLIKHEIKETEQGVSILPSNHVSVSMITVSMKGVYLVTTPEGRKRMDKIEAQKQGLQVVESCYVEHSTKGFFSKTANFKKLLGLKLEPILLDNPFDKREIVFKVFYEGNPAEGVLVYDAFHKELGKTGSDGLIKLKKEELRLKERYYAVVFFYKVKTFKDPKADYLWFITSLTWQE